MKKLKIYKGVLPFMIIFFIICILQSFTFTRSTHSSQVDIREVTVSGHKYVVASSTAGVSIIHSHSCSAQH